MSVLCIKCESEKASLECSECGQLFNVATALLCEGCSTGIHQSSEFNAHTVKPITYSDDSEETAEIENGTTTSSSDWLDSETSSIHKMIGEIQANQELLKEQIKMGMDNFKQLLDTRLAELLANVDLISDRKLKVLNQHLDHCKAIADRGEPQPPLFPTLPGNVSCGFAPPMATLHHATACLMTDSSGEVGEGDRVSVTAIGSVDTHGCFSVRLLPDRDGLQDITLQNISNSLEIEHALVAPSSRPQSLSPGQLCSARYSADQRWYRAKVIDVSTGGRGKTQAKVYFLDHGNTEEMSTTSIAPLDEKYQVFPFQMIQCCFSMDPKYSYSEREVRWKFNDLTHGRCLMANILHRLPDNARGKLFLVQLWDETGSQRQDIGASVLGVAEAKSRSQKDSIRYRDVRYKDQPLPPHSKQIITSTTSSAAMTPPSTTPEPDKPVQPPTTEPVKPVQPPTTEPDKPVQPPTTEPVQPVQPPISTQSLSTHTPSASTEVDRSKQSSSPPPPSSSPPPDFLSSNQQPAESSTKSAQDDTNTAASSLTAPKSTSILGPPPFPIASQAVPVPKPSSESSAPSLTEPPPPSLSSQAELPRPTSLVADSALTNDRPQVVADGHEAVTNGVEVGMVKEAESVPEGEQEKPSEPVPSEEGPVQLVVGKTSELRAETVEEKEKEKSKVDLSSSEEELLRLMHPSVVAGAELEAYVATPLSADGSFWIQLTPDSSSYDQLAEEMRERLSETREVMTPVFFNVGDLCAALFSEDESWYRARITGASGGLFTVRYLDFGNSEKREARHLFALRSEFRQLPFQAVHCSIVSEDHPSFTQPEIDKFNKIVPIEEPVTINVLRTEGTTVYVEVHLKLPGGTSVDLTDEVYSADVTHFKSIDFGAATKTLPSASLPPSSTTTTVPDSDIIDAKQAPPTDDAAGENGSSDTALCPLPSPLPLSVSDSLTHRSNWADEMDAIQSPKDDGFLTLPGHESQGPSDRSKSPSPCPTETHTGKEQGRLEESNSMEPQPRRGGRKERDSSRSTSPRPVRPSRPAAGDRDGKVPSTSPSRVGGAGVSGSRSAPRLDLGVTTRLILSGIGHSGSSRSSSREGRRREREGGGAAVSEKTAGKKLEVEQNRVPVSRDHWGSRSPSPHRPSSSAPSHTSDKRSTTTSSKPESDVVQLFVKNIPSNMSSADVSKLFATFGKVHHYIQDKLRKQVVYIHMSPESAQKAITGLHGKAIAKNCHPLVIEKSAEKRF